MPVYQYRCKGCKEEVEVRRAVKDRLEALKCPRCLGELQLVPSLPFVKIWKPLTLEHVEKEPRTFNSESELRGYCKERKLESGALL